jgi:hypothetical protein
MPVAAVHKDRPFALAVRELRCTWERSDVQPVGNAQITERLADGELGLGAPLAHPSHEGASFGIGLKESTLGHCSNASQTGLRVQRAQDEPYPPVP